ncbi:MAG TPA: response regulator [Candidatus Peribacteraceae bacterium]|nr:response regulator [Candidatus Peribacteraceae bacterium]
MNKQQHHILIAEDEAFLLDMMAKALRKHGMRVSTALNGQEAIDILDKDPPDLLLLDLLMPQVDGFAVLRHRKEKKMKFPVVVCTNLSDKTSIITCNEFDVNEYLIKSDMDDEQIWTVAEKYLH